SPTDEVIGTQTVTSGFPATVSWTGLTEGETYAWTAVSTEAGEDDGVISQFGGTFVATAAGTDTEPPVLTIPEPSTVEVGATFDVYEGVSAIDNVDGDISDRIEVIGGVDTSTAGQYVLTYRVEDTNGNQAVGSRLVTVAATSEPGEPGEPGAPGVPGEPGDEEEPGEPGDEDGPGESGDAAGPGDAGVPGAPAEAGGSGPSSGPGTALPSTGVETSLAVAA